MDPAQCQLRRAGEGELVLEQGQPFTFREAVVADDGRAACSGDTRRTLRVRHDDPGELVFLAQVAHGEHGAAFDPLAPSLDLTPLAGYRHGSTCATDR